MGDQSNRFPAAGAGRSWNLTYHEILPEDSTYLYRVSSFAFEKHLEFLSGISKASSTAAVHISFDDGHRSNFENAFPLLERSGLKATFFVLAGNVGVNADYISWEQAKELSNAGHTVASHGWSHRMLTLCDPEELRQEVSNSKKEIEERLGIEVKAISAPGGRWNRQVVDACEQAGYRFFFHSNPWTSSQTAAKLSVQGRLMITRHMGPDDLKKQMALSDVSRFILRTKYAAKESIRRMIGERRYHELWCKLAGWNPEDGMEVQVGGEPTAKIASKRA